MNSPTLEQETFDNASWLISAVQKAWQVHDTPEVKSILSRFAEQNLQAPSFRMPEPRQQAVTRYFPDTIAETMLVQPSLAAPLAAVDGLLHWEQSASYTDALLGEGFSQNYSWCQLIGPNGFFPGDDFLLGLLLLGPHRHYKDHYHPAPELYWPLTGDTSWKQGLGSFVAKSAGDLIFHAPFVHHATKTAGRPMLAVWCWPSQTTTPAELAGK